MSKKADRELIRRIETTRALLSEFGLQTYGYDPGVLCRDANGVTVDLDSSTWRWLEPLLIELRNFRAPRNPASTGEVKP
jgi:hypothetical protein